MIQKSIAQNKSSKGPSHQLISKQQNENLPSYLSYSTLWSSRIPKADPDVYLFFFLDDTHYTLTATEAKTSVVQFLKRKKEVRSGMGKRLSTAYALAAVELESQRAAASAFECLSTAYLEAQGGLGEMC